MNRNKNIIIISFDFCLEAGGIQNTAYLLAVELAKYANVFTLCPADGNTPDHSGVKALKSRYAISKGERFDYTKEAIEIAEKVHLQNTIHYVLCVHYAYSQPAYYLKKKYNIPYGILVHGNEVMHPTISQLSHHPGLVKSLLIRCKLLSYSTQIFANTNYTKKLAKNTCLIKNIFVVQPPVDIENIIIPENSSNKVKNKVLLTICRLVERKGIQLVIKSLPRVIKSIPDIKYIVAGTGEYEEILKALVSENKLEKYVEFKGRVTEAEKSTLLSECGLFIMPSFMIKSAREVEGYGVSFLEANLFGKFVISSFTGGVPEAIKSNVTGFLVEECDVEGISKAILRFYDDSFSYNPSDCVQWAMDHHISKIAKQYWDIIVKVIK